jgi:hypothetical protein
MPIANHGSFGTTEQGNAIELPLGPNFLINIDQHTAKNHNHHQNGITRAIEQKHHEADGKKDPVDEGE